MRPRVLRVLRGNVPVTSLDRVMAVVRDEVLPSTASLDGLEASALGMREEGDDLVILAVSVWRDEPTLGAAKDDPRPSSAFGTLRNIVSFEPARAFDIVIADWPTTGPIRGGAIGAVEVTVAASDEGAVHGLIARQQETLRDDGFVRAFFVGRRPRGADVDIAAVALWPDRDALGAFLASRPEGPGIDDRLRSLSKALRFEVVDLVDPSRATPNLHVPAALALDGERNIVDVSAGLGRHLGAPPEELLGRRFDDLLAPGDAARLEEQWSAPALHASDGVVVSLYRLDGGAVPMRLRALADVPAPGLSAILLEPPASPPSADIESVVRRSLGGWRTRASRTRTRQRPLPRLITMPSTDRLFARFTSIALDTFETPSMRRLQLYLRRVYPHAVVHRREISAERETWYVFRDGRLSRSTGDDWWRHDGVAVMTLARDGSITEANAEAIALLHPHDPILGRASRGSALWRADDDLALLTEVAFAEPSSDSTIRLFTSDSEPLDVRLHAERSGSNLRIAFQPTSAPEAVRDWFAPLCLPPSDEEFAARTEELCDRLAGRDASEVAAELQMRLRVRYPSASVAPLSRLTGFGPRTQVLLVRRDGEPDDAERWWMTPGVARVRIERGRYVDANEAAAELHGVTREELLASPLGRFRMSGDERLLMRDVLRRAGFLHTTTHLERGDGHAIEVEFHATLVSRDPQVVEVAIRPSRVHGPGVPLKTVSASASGWRSESAPR